MTDEIKTALECLEKLQSNIRPLNDYYYGEEQRKCFETIKQALIEKTKVKIDYYTKEKINRYFLLLYNVDCDGDEILHDMKTPEEVEEMFRLKKELEEKGIEV